MKNDLYVHEKLSYIYPKLVINGEIRDEEELSERGNNPILISSKYKEYEESVNIFREFFKSDPYFIIRVPYIIDLLGDNITNILNKKLLTTLSDDIILYVSYSLTREMNIEFCNLPKLNKSFPMNLKDKSLSNEEIEDQIIRSYPHLYYVLKGINDSIKKCDLLEYEENEVKGLNILITLGPYHMNKYQSYILLYIASFIAGIAFYKFDYKENISNSNLMNIIISSIEENNFFEREELKEHKSLVQASSLYVNSIFMLNINEVGIFSKGKLERKYKMNENYSILNLDSFSNEPPTFYRIVNHENKRMIEVYFGIAIILISLKNNKNSLLIDFIYSSLKKSDFEDKANEYIKFIIENHIFFDIFNTKSIREFISLYIDDKQYTISDIRNILGNEIFNLILNMNEYGENIKISNKSFELHSRITFLVNELERINRFLEIIEENNICKSSDLLLFKLINQSNSELISLYDSQSDEMINLGKNILSINSNICFRLTGNGWNGHISILSNNKNIKLYMEIFTKRIDQIRSTDKNAKLWITNDDIEYCRFNSFGGTYSILNPKYEDFMINLNNN